MTDQASLQKQQLIEEINKTTLLIDLYPKREFNYLKRGKAYSVLGRQEEAVADYTKAIQINPKNYNTFLNRGLLLINLGIAFYELGNREEAVLDFSEAIRLRPFEKKNYYNRGRTLFDLGRIEESINDFTKAITIRQKYDKAYTLRGYMSPCIIGCAFYELEKYKESIEDFTTAISLKPQKANNYYNRGVALRRVGQLKQASVDFQQITYLPPQTHYDYLLRGIMFKENCLPTSALIEFDKAIKANPSLDKAYYYHLKGFVQYMIGLTNLAYLQYKEATEDFTRALNINPLQEYYGCRAFAFSQFGKNELALNDYTQAKNACPENSVYYYNRGYLTLYCRHCTLQVKKQRRSNL